MIRRFISAILSLVIFVIAVGVSLHFGYECIQCYNSNEWETTSGRVVFNGTDEYPIGHFVSKIPAVAERISPEIRETRIPMRVVRYEYKLGTETKTGDRISFGRFALLDALPVELDNLRADYPVGKKVEITYNPLDADCAVLDPTMLQEGLIALGVSVFFSVAVGGSFFLKRRNQHENCR